MAFTFIALAAGFSDTSGTTLNTSGTLEIEAGDLLVCWGKHEGATVTFSALTISAENTFTFDAGDQVVHGNGDLETAFGYVLSAIAESAATCSLNFSAARPFRSFIVLQFRPTSGFAVAKDGSNRATGTSTAPNSGNITTTGNDGVAVGAFGPYAGFTTSAELIDGVSATEPAGSPVNSRTSIWYRILSAVIASGAASATLSSNEWTCGVIAFKQTGGGPAASFPPYSMNPMSKLIVR